MLHLMTSVATFTVLLRVLQTSSASPTVNAHESPNPLHALLPRTAPVDQLCGSPANWFGRTCNGVQGIQAWADICHEREVEGACAEGTQCFDTIDRDDQSNVHCLPTPLTEADTRKHRQSGIFAVPAGQDMVSIQIVRYISHASLSAYLEDTNQTYVVTPQSLTGLYRDTPDTEACVFDTYRINCQPTDFMEFEAGHWVDFSVGILAGQRVNLVYAIMGRHPG